MNRQKYLNIFELNHVKYLCFYTNWRQFWMMTWDDGVRYRYANLQNVSKNLQQSCDIMKTSGRGNAFRISGPLWGKSIHRRWILVAMIRVLMVPLLLDWTSCWTAVDALDALTGIWRHYYNTVENAHIASCKNGTSQNLCSRLCFILLYRSWASTAFYEYPLVLLHGYWDNNLTINQTKLFKLVTYIQ